MIIKTLMLLSKKKAWLLFLAFISGYSLWLLVRQGQVTTLDISIPIRLYCTPNAHHKTVVPMVKAPLSVALKLRGCRQLLAQIGKEQLAIMVNVNELQAGTTTIAITPERLNLPASITLITGSPEKNILTLSVEKMEKHE